MSTQIAFLRGVNVGAKNRIRMEDLRAALEAVGFSRVETYIQSGNALFDSSAPAEENASAVARVLSEGFGVKAGVIVRTAEELYTLICALPFSEGAIARAKAANPDVECLYAFFFSSPLAAEAQERLLSLASENERLAFIKRDAYLLLDGSIRLSKLAAALQNTAFGGTARNQKTLLALAELARKRENRS